jgi:hypothetical protein
MKQHGAHEQCSEYAFNLAVEHHYHHPYEAGTHGSRIGPSDCPKSHHIIIHALFLALENSNLGQQDQAIRLTISLGNQPFGITVGKPQA